MSKNFGLLTLRKEINSDSFLLHKMRRFSSLSSENFMGFEQEIYSSINIKAELLNFQYLNQNDLDQ